MKPIRIIIFLVAGLLAIFPVMAVNADVNSNEELTRASANIPVPLLVNGIETDGAVQSVPIGSIVCISTAIKYTRPNERHRFFNWENQPILGSTLSTERNLDETNQSLADECIVVTQGGTYTANYIHEVLFQVRSGVDAYKQSRWVEKDTIVDLTVPEIVEETGNVRYRFNGWSGGESPFTPENRIAVLAPTVLELGWTVEYNIKVEDVDGNLSPMSGWYRSNDTFVIRTPEEILMGDGNKKLTFEKWEVVYGPPLKKSTNPSMALLVDGPCLLRPIYTVSFLVEAKYFRGILSHEWVQADEKVEIEAPALVEISPERERYVFGGWQGKEGLEGNELNLTVDNPLYLEAVYQRQFKLSVRSPYGASGEGWYNEGEKAIIMAPKEPQSMIFFKRSFDGFLGIGNGGYGDGTTLSDNPVTTVQVNEPMTITASYRSEINPKVLFLMLGVLAVGTLAYLGTEWGPGVYRRLRPKVFKVPVLSEEHAQLEQKIIELGALNRLVQRQMTEHD